MDEAGNVSACSASFDYTHMPPRVTVADAAAFEGRALSTSSLSFTVTLRAALASAVKVTYATESITPPDVGSPLQCQEDGLTMDVVRVIRR